MRSGTDDIFISKLKTEIDDNLTNEQFSVEALAKNIGMSRSQLHRKLNTVTGQSISQFIREHRLTLSMELLKDGDLTAAEVADKVGFGSPTYFNKCFNEYYGFPPGEVKNRIGQLTNIPKHLTITEDDEDYIIEEEREGKLKHLSIQPGSNTPSKTLPWIGISIAAAVVLIAAFGVYRYFASGDTVDVGAKGKSIAILPFKNLSEDQRNEYFSEGMIEAIRTSLSQVGAIRVISRTSVEQYRNTKKSAKEIADELGVAALLEGSVQRNNNAVRVEVHLVDGSSEAQVWSKTFDRELKDVFVIQSEIAQQVAEELHTKLTVEERSRLSATETENPKAYDLYLKGIYEFRTYTNRGTHNAIALLSQAIELDSTYARAYAYLAYSHICLASIFGAERSALQGLESGKPFIDKALAIDPSLDIAHMLMGFYHLYYSWDLKIVEAEYKQAVVNNDPDALAMYCDFLNFARRHKEAMAYAEKLNEVDPYYPNSRMVLSLYYNGRYAEAKAFSESRVQLFHNYYSLDSHGFLMLQLGRYPEAIEYFNRAIALEGIRYPRMLGWMGAAYARSGDWANAQKIISEFKVRHSKGEAGSIAFFLAAIYSALDNKDEALRWLETAYQSHDMEMPWIMTEPQFYSLHNEPRFQKIASAVGYRSDFLPAP